jgi:transposase
MKMPSPYSEDLRLRAVEAYENGEGSQIEIAERFKISLPTFERYWRRYKQTGSVSAIAGKKGRPRLISAEKSFEVRKIIENPPDITLQEICDEYNRRNKTNISIFVMYGVVKKLGFRRKKKSHYALEQERPDIKK